MPRLFALGLGASLVGALFGTALGAPSATTSASYEYIVVGSGAGGGPLASRLAIAGHSVLLIEAGDDQGMNVNYTVPSFQPAVSEDPKLRWDMFVNHYQDPARAQRDPKYVYDVGGGQQYVGFNPPKNAKPLGILYPRAGTLGGCVSHNALIWILPHASDWDNIAKITGDSSWSASNMEQYIGRIAEWLPTSPTDPTLLLKDEQLLQHVVAGAEAMGVKPSVVSTVQGLVDLFTEDPNARTPGRDGKEGYFQIPLIQKDGARSGVREFIVDTVGKGFPLTVQTNTHVTKVLFDTSGKTPRATGVEYLNGAHLYRASPLSGGRGTPGSVYASKEVILAGGTFNTVQMLKLSGIGPEAELKSFGIKTLVNLPGVGTNMQDRYEVPLNVEHTAEFKLLDGCTFDAQPHDACFQKWNANPHPAPFTAARGTYASNGLVTAMGVHSDDAPTSDLDLFIFSAPFYFTGYFPGWATAVLPDIKHFSWYALKAHTRNTAGTVALRSADPLEPPVINFNYFDTGTTTGGADKEDLAALVQAIRTGRQALKNYNGIGNLLKIIGEAGSPFTEVQPGANVTSDADLGQYVKDHAWGHHASCSNKIGADGDPSAVLDSEFRVRGTLGLRVVDASVFPSIPGIFIQAPVMMVSEKAADVILQAAASGKKP